jgi:hypothetical protein
MQHRMADFRIMSTFAAIYVDDGSLIYVDSLQDTCVSWNTWWNGCRRIDNKCKKVEKLLMEKFVELDVKCLKVESDRALLLTCLGVPANLYNGDDNLM